MSIEYQKHQKVALREAGKDEKWLQEQIATDPSILGLGDLTLFKKELTQRAGGRLDILLSDPETETMYEVEVMLGATDPSHIIRTIEYWDVESRRYRDREHRAVIVAEEITNRFFNVIWLLNRSLPIIAIQLDALTIDGKLLLHFTKVLDIYEPQDVSDEQGEIVDEDYWLRHSSPEAMAVFQRFKKLLEDNAIQVTFNFRQDGIALAGRLNFARITPRKSGYCLLYFSKRLPEELRKEGREKLKRADISIQEMSGERFSVRLDNKTLTDQGAEILVDLIRRGAKDSSAGAW
jgi:hypothetical protein